MYITHIRTQLALALVLVFYCAGCGHRAAEGERSPDQPMQESGNRSVSSVSYKGVSPLFKYGAGWNLSAPKSNVSGLTSSPWTATYLNASPDWFAGAHYDFTVSPPFDLQNVKIYTQWQGAPPTPVKLQLWLYNYSTQNVDVFANYVPMSGGLGYFQVTDLAPYLQTFGVYATLVVRDLAHGPTATFTLKWIRVGGDVPPTAYLERDIASGPSPLTVHFDASESKGNDNDPIVNYEWDFDDDGIYNESNNNEDDYLGMSSATAVYTGNGQHWASVRVSDSATPPRTHVAKQVVYIYKVEARIEVTDPVPPTGSAPLHVTLDASDSWSEGGRPIVKYEFKRYANDTWQDNGSDASYEYDSVAGSHKPSVRVTDDWNQVGTRTLTNPIIVSGGAWHYLDVTSLPWAASYERFTDLYPMVADGRPAMVYQEHTNSIETLKFVIAEDAFGESWESPVTIDVASVSASLMDSIILSNGKPACAWRDGGGDLYFAYADDLDGTSWNPVYIDHTLANTTLSLELVEDKPVITMRGSGSSSHIVFWYASNEAGSSWEASTVPAPDVDFELSSTFDTCIIDGRVGAVFENAYYDQQQLVQHEYSFTLTDAPSATQWLPLQGIHDNNADASGFTHGFPSLCLVAGRPAACINYSDSPSSAPELWFTRSLDSLGNAWPSAATTLIDEGQKWPRMDVVGGYPAIAYCKGNGLYYVCASDSTGSTWPTPEELDPFGSKYPHLFSINDCPAIPYYHRAQGELGNTDYIRLAIYY